MSPLACSRSPFFTNVTNVGINAAESAPSAKILRNELGIFQAVIKASATAPDPK